MPDIILDGNVVTDSWTKLSGESGEQDLAGANILIPLALWNEHHEQLSDRQDVGVWLDSDQLPEQLLGNWQQLAVIGVNFPVFADGRGFSIARLLRQRYGYLGQVRAIGAPIRDQLFYLQRCGFNAIALAEHYNPAEAIESLNDFSEVYQTATDQALPLFRRRL